MRLRAVALTVALASCGGDAPPPPADSVASQDVVVLDTAVTPADGCLKEGLWQWCSVLDRLERAGVVLTPRDSAPPNDLFHGQRRTFTVGAGEDEIHVFLYESDAARRADTGAIDSATVSPKGERRSYRVQPLLVTSNNLAALVFTMNERTSERLSLALSAGLPPSKR
jgi:hypothetical protein